MLQRLLPKFLCPVCRNPTQDLTATIFRAEGEIVIDGWLTCLSCGTAYPVVDRLLDLVPPGLLESASVDELRRRHASAFASTDPFRRQQPGRVDPATDYGAQLKQRSHFDDYATHQAQNYAGYAAMPFWRAVDDWTFAQWQPDLRRETFLLDIGCADGRSSFPHVDRHYIVGFDISRKMIRRAIDEARRRGQAHRCTFFVADGAALPFKDGSFPYAQTYGVLHHLPAPERAVHEIQRVLEPGGVHLGSENNDTGLRRLFDALMRVCPIWREEAGEQPLISRDMLDRWTRDLAVEITSDTIVFLPPHVFNLLSQKRARSLLEATNRLARLIPGLRNHGGLLVFQIRKPA